jgi:uncharacterized membrane protein YidH (DUF202 family)
VSVPFDVGLQRERTALAWTRTALALVANGLLVLVRNEGSIPLPVAVTLSVLWVLLAIATVFWSFHRRGLIGTADDAIRPASRIVWALGVSIGTLCVATALAIAFT